MRGGSKGKLPQSEIQYEWEMYDMVSTTPGKPHVQRGKSGRKHIVRQHIAQEAEVLARYFKPFLPQVDANRITYALLRALTGWLI